MKLNAHIIYEELAPMEPQASLHSDRLERRFDFHSPMIDFRTPSSNLIYNVTADQLEELVARGVRPRGAFVCSGRPPEAVLQSACDVIWIESAPVIGEMVARMTEIFTRYMLWESAVHEAVIKGASLRDIAELSAPIIGRPLWAWDAHYQTLFSIVEPERYPLPDDYLFQDDLSTWKAWMIAQWEDESKAWGDRLLRLREPYFMPSPAEGAPSYRCLCANIFHGATRTATVCMDEVGAQLTDRDFALIDVLAELMAQGLDYGGGAEPDTAQVFDGALVRALRGQRVPRGELDGAREALGWGVDDEYYLVVLEAIEGAYSDRLLTRLAHELCLGVDGLAYTVHDHRLVVGVNDNRVGLSPRSLVGEVERRLLDQGIDMRIGVSSAWLGLGRMRRAYVQALRALEVGARHFLERCVHFDDVLLRDVLARCGGEDAEALLPLGLRRLMIHDRRQDDDLCETLRVYLDCNGSMSAAARQLFVHRNTLAYKMDRIKRIAQTDLADPDERLLLSLGLRLR